MKILMPMLLLPAILAATNLPSLSRHESKPVSFAVVDQDGKPVAGALVEASRTGSKNATGTTNSEGLVELELIEGASLFVEVSREGYYATGGELWPGGFHRDADRKMTPRKLPDSFRILLKQVIEPVELTRFQYAGLAPLVDKPAGFDLVAGDWVEPYGKGRRADLFFLFRNITATPGSCSGTLTLVFPDPNDGIQPFEAARPHSVDFGSNLAPPHRAPVEGYDREHTVSLTWKKGDPAPFSGSNKSNYLLRVRTVTDENGRIRKACYGWIEGEIKFDPRGNPGPQLSFSGYLNTDPDPDARSLENAADVPDQP